MTRYSIPSETPAQNLFTLTTDDRQREVESLDWESRMARLVGFEEAPPSIQEVEEPAIQPSPEQPQEVQTKQPLSSNPFAKLGLVGMATLSIVLLAGGFLSQLMNSGNQKPQSEIPPQVRSQPVNESPSQNLAAEVETLKTKLALTEQVELVKAAQQKLRTTKPTPAVALQPPAVSSRNRPQVVPQTTPAPVRTVYVPRVVTVPSPPQRPVVSQPLPVVQPTVNVTPPPPPNPLDEWSRLAKLGSYGQVNVSDKPNVMAATSEPPQNTQVAQQPPNPNPNQTPPQEPSVANQGQQQSQKSVAVGTSVKAVLATAVFGETTKARNNDDNDENKNVFVVRLKEPLKAVDGAIALPANTELLTEVRSISEQGLLQLNIVKVIVKNNGTPTERSLPQNALIVRAPQGRPLLAQQFPNQGGAITGMDIGLFALGAVGKVGEVLNRPDTRVECVNTPTLDTNTNTNTNSNENSNNQTYRDRYCFQSSDNRRNILAGLLEGGMNTVVPQIAQRNQQAISQMMQRTNVWFVAAGKNVEIYVNQSIQF
ncbi:TrbI/VirB10 family protein [Nostoc sp. MG11]|uniref:TrbI/VirB10 family protein n=1 Tax=Nostoc sp. MG11 TaxID=2721166 RepID=UPI001866B950|nr:TrbI/VirB10 family protein [Nostoc sp. MG11]